MSFSIIATLGPKLFNDKEKLKRIHAAGPIVYRINGAHTSETQVREILEVMKDLSPKPKLMIDLPGNKIRTANLEKPIELRKGQEFFITNDQLNFPNYSTYLKVGDTITANDSKYQFNVVRLEGNKIVMTASSNGQLLNRKGFHLQGRHHDLPFLFDKDLQLINLASKFNVDYLSLSFVRTVDDINQVKAKLKELGNTTTQLFAKIETAAAVENLEQILQHVDTVNIDRGDLSADIGLMNLPQAQEKITQAAIKHKKRIFLATQFLKNMEINPLPLIAEMNDLYRAVKSGVSGIQLSEETAVGEYPAECVELVFEVYKQFGS